MDGDFTGLRGEHRALQADDIADIHFLEISICFLTYKVPRHIALNGPFQVLNVTEGGLAHHALGHHPPGDADFLPFQFVIVPDDIRAVMGYVVLCDDKRILSGFLQFRQLVPADLKQLVHIPVFHFCHVPALFLSYSLLMEVTL